MSQVDPKVMRDIEMFVGPAPEGPTEEFGGSAEVSGGTNKYGLVEGTLESIGSILSGDVVQEKTDLNEGAVKSWIADRVSGAMDELDVPDDQRGEIEDAVFQAALSGSLGDGTMSPETTDAIKDLVVQVAGEQVAHPGEPAAPDEEPELEPMLKPAPEEEPEVEPPDKEPEVEPEEPELEPDEEEPEEPDLDMALPDEEPDLNMGMEPLPLEPDEGGDLDNALDRLIGKKPKRKRSKREDNPLKTAVGNVKLWSPGSLVMLTGQPLMCGRVVDDNEDTVTLVTERGERRTVFKAQVRSMDLPDEIVSLVLEGKVDTAVEQQANAMVEDSLSRLGGKQGSDPTLEARGKGKVDPTDVKKARGLFADSQHGRWPSQVFQANAHSMWGWDDEYSLEVFKAIEADWVPLRHTDPLPDWFTKPKYEGEAVLGL